MAATTTDKIVESKRSTHPTEEEEIDDVEPGDEDLVEEIFDDEEEEEVGEPRQQVKIKDLKSYSKKHHL